MSLERLKEKVEMGDPDAMAELAAQYFSGTVDITTDYDTAFKLYKTASIKGSFWATHMLGICYQEGLGTKQNLPLAAKCYQEAANKGITAAKHNLAVLYDGGVGVEKDRTKAVEYYKQAAANNYRSSILNLANILAENGPFQDKFEALRLYAKSVKMDNPKALPKLNRFLEQNNLDDILEIKKAMTQSAEAQ